MNSAGRLFREQNSSMLLFTGSIKSVKVVPNLSRNLLPSLRCMTMLRGKTSILSISGALKVLAGNREFFLTVIESLPISIYFSPLPSPELIMYHEKEERKRTGINVVFHLKESGFNIIQVTASNAHTIPNMSWNALVSLLPLFTSSE